MSPGQVIKPLLGGLVCRRIFRRRHSWGLRWWMHHGCGCSREWLRFDLGGLQNWLQHGNRIRGDVDLWRTGWRRRAFQWLAAGWHVYRFLAAGTSYIGPGSVLRYAETELAVWAIELNGRHGSIQPRKGTRSGGTVRIITALHNNINAKCDN